MEKTSLIKATIAGIGAFLSAKLGILYIVLPLLMVTMVIDYLTGMLAAKKEGKISSKIGTWGIVKKVMYAVEVMVSMIVDWTIINIASSLGVNIPTTTFFGILVAIWLIVNELVSILENLTRLEVPLPSFLLKIVDNFKVVIETNGNKLAEQIKEDSKSSF